MTLANLNNVTANPILNSLSNAPITPQLGAFYPYDSQLPLPEEAGNRVVKCLYQVITSGVNKGKKHAENAYCRVPTGHLTEESIVARVAELSPFILDWLQGIEDAEIKKYHKDGGTQVFLAGLSLDSIIEKLEESEAGSRLNKEKISAWFKASVEPELMDLFAGKLGLTEHSSEAELAKLELVLRAYETKFTSLAGGKATIKEDDCKAMISVIEQSGAIDTTIGKRFTARLGKMHSVVEDLLMSL